MRCEAAFGVEHRNLAEHLARRMDGQQLHTAIRRLPDKFDPAGFQKIHAMIRRSLAEDHIAPVVHPLVEIFDQFTGLFRRHLLEQRGVEQNILLLWHCVRLIRHCAPFP